MLIPYRHTPPLEKEMPDYKPYSISCSCQMFNGDAISPNSLFGKGADRLQTPLILAAYAGILSRRLLQNKFPQQSKTYYELDHSAIIGMRAIEMCSPGTCNVACWMVGILRVKLGLWVLAKWPMGW